MINPELPDASREELLKRLETQLNELVKLDKENHNLQNTLKIADDSLETYKHEMKRLDTLVHEHIDDKESFFDAVVEAFDIELTKTVTVQYKVSVEVQATVPASMTTEEVEKELAGAKLDYEFLGNSDIEIDGFDFGDLEVE
jgi:predicted nuclease with TOPRIM domain